jgi:uncharacterized protein (PEP-CTERM system associated)
LSPVAIGLALAYANSTAMAGDLTIAPSLTLSQSYSDNIDLDQSGDEESAFITEATPSFRLRSEGARSEAALDAASTFAYSSDGDDKGIEVIPNVAGFGTLELSRSLLFFDAETSVSKELLNSEQADTASNRETTAVLRASPYLTNRLGDYADSELRYTFEQIFVDSGSEDFSDDTIHRGSWQVDSDEALANLSSTFIASGAYSDRSSDHNIERVDILTELEYAVSPIFSLIAGGGYQRYDDGDSQNDVGDPAWEAGFRLHSANGELKATYGKREGDDSFAADLRYKLGAWTSVRAGYAEVLETGQDRLASDLSSIGEDPDTGILIDDRTGLPFNPDTGDTSLTNQTARTKRGRLDLIYDRHRDLIGIGGSIEDQDDQTSNDDEKIKAVNVFWEHQMNRRLSFRVSGRYEHSKFEDDGRKDDEYLANALISYNLYRNVSAFASYLYRHKDSNDPTDEYEENRVTAGIRIEF